MAGEMLPESLTVSFLSPIFPVLPRTIIAGMATGSIVAFNINFSKWHHEFRDTY